MNFVCFTKKEMCSSFSYSAMYLKSDSCSLGGFLSAFFHSFNRCILLFPFSNKIPKINMVAKTLALFFVIVQAYKKQAVKYLLSGIYLFCFLHK